MKVKIGILFYKEINFCIYFYLKLKINDFLILNSFLQFRSQMTTTIENIREQMEALDDNKENMTDNEYLSKSNQLHKEYKKIRDNDNEDVNVNNLFLTEITYLFIVNARRIEIIRNQ